MKNATSQTKAQKGIAWICSRHYSSLSFFSSRTIISAALSGAILSPSLLRTSAYPSSMLLRQVPSGSRRDSSAAMLSTENVSATSSLTTSRSAMRLTSEIYLTFNRCLRRKAMTFGIGVS